MSKHLPLITIYFHEDLDGTFVLEDETTGVRYLDMLPHDICSFLEALQEQHNLDDMSLISND